MPGANADTTTATNSSTPADKPPNAVDVLPLAEPMPSSTARANETVEQPQEHQPQNDPAADWSPQVNIKTMSVADFLSTTQPHATNVHDKQGGVSGRLESSTSFEERGTTHQSTSDTVSYPSIKVESESPPATSNVHDKENLNAGSIWDIPETPHK